MSKVAVIGGLGLIGSAVVEKLLTLGREVLVIDTSGSQDKCDSVFGKGVQYANQNIVNFYDYKILKGCEGVYNFAGMLGTTELEFQKRASVEVNIIGALNVFDAAINAGCEYVFYPTKPDCWLNTYTITKCATDQFAQLYNKNTDLKVCCLRYFNVFGPRQHTHPIRKMIPYFAMQAIKKQPLEIFGDGEQTVDLIYSQDVAKITVEFVEKRWNSSIPDLGRGVSITVNEVASFVNDHLYNHKVAYLPMRMGETPRTKLVADLKVLSDIIPLEFSDFQKTMEETLDYYANLPISVIEDALWYYKK